MPKIERTTQPVFGELGNNDEFAVFGSMKSGTPVYSKNPATLFQSPSYVQGWQDAVAADKAPFLEETNGLFYALSSQLAYLFQTGLPEWDQNTVYYANTSFCQANGIWYQSLTDDNIGNNPIDDTDNINWKKVEFGGGSASGGHNLFDIIISDHILEGQEAAGKALQGTYTLSTDTAFYAKCLEEKTAATQSTITVGDYSFTGYIYNGHIFYDISDKPIVDNIYNATGKAFYFGIDTQNQRVFLPRLKNVFIGMGNLTDTIRAKGNNLTVGLTNGTKKAGFTGVDYAGVSGYFGRTTNTYGKPVGTASTSTGVPGNVSWGLDTDSVNSGIVLDGQTIEDNAQEGYLYFCVGNTFVNTANIDVEELTGDVRNLEANALTRDDKQEIVSWGIPDYSAGSDITGYTSTTNMFSAPVDGYVVGYNSGLAAESSVNIELYTPGNELIFKLANRMFPPDGGTNSYASATLLLPKGYKVLNSSKANATLLFYPLKGAN